MFYTTELIIIVGTPGRYPTFSTYVTRLKMRSALAIFSDPDPHHGKTSGF